MKASLSWRKCAWAQVSVSAEESLSHSRVRSLCSNMRPPPYGGIVLLAHQASHCYL